MAELTCSAPRGEITFTVDDARKRLTLVSRGEVDGAVLRKAYEQLLAAHPQVRTWDMVLDLLEDRNAVTAGDVPSVADLFAPQGDDPRSPCHVAIVTTDPNFALWARAMDFQFGGFRIHSVYPKREAAEAFLDSVADRPRD
jgi:hypothetical protein